MGRKLLGAVVVWWGLWAGMAFGGEGMFPLEKGTLWRYAGTVQWTEEGGTEPKTAPISWDMEILDALTIPGGTAVVVRGMVSETSGYMPDQEPGYSVLVETKSRVELFPQPSELEARTFAKSLAVEPGPFPEGDLLLELPLAKDKAWGSEGPRDDHMYQWFVEEERENSTPASGAPSSGRLFLVAYRTNPDTTTMELAPGVGITRWTYEHHGTVSATDLRLVALERGK